MNRYFNAMSLKWIKPFFMFALSLCFIELLIVGVLIPFTLWVESDLCPSALQASGHCYADWFAWYERGLYCLTLVLMNGTLLWLAIRFYPAMTNTQLKKLFWCLAILLTILSFYSDFRFIGEAVTALVIVHCILRYKLYSIEPKKVS